VRKSALSLTGSHPANLNASPMICTLTPETKLTYGHICTNGIDGLLDLQQASDNNLSGRPTLRPHDTEFLVSICARRFGGLRS